MPATLAPLSATVLVDGYTLRLIFTAPVVPASVRTPDWLPGAQAGPAVTVTASGGAVAAVGDDTHGGLAETWDLPIFLDSENFTNSTLWTAGDYCIAYALYDSNQSKEIAWSAIAHFVVTGSGTVRVPELQSAGGNGLPSNLSVNVYLSAPNGSPTLLASFLTGLRGIHFRDMSGTAPPTTVSSNAFLSGSPLAWTCQYKLSRPITLGETVSVTGPANLWQDSAGNATAAFAGVAVANNSLVDSTGFTSRALSPPDTLGNVAGLPQTRWYVSQAGNDANLGTFASPVQTIEQAYKLMSAAGTLPSKQPCWAGIALRRGDVFIPQKSFGLFGRGIGPTMPTVMESYWDSSGADPGTRPVIASDYSGYPAALPSFNPGQYAMARDISFNNINLDGCSPGINSLGDVGNPIAGLVVSDCTFLGFGGALDWECSLATDNFTVGAVLGVGITSPGLAYTGTPTVTFDAPPVGGTQATGTAIMGGPGNAYVVGVTITAAGAKYTAIPGVTFSGGGASQQATGVVQLQPMGDPLGGYLRSPVLHRTAILDTAGISVLSSVHDDFLVSQCVFDTNGHGGIGDWSAGSSIFNHDLYFHVSARPATVWGSLSRRSSGISLMLRCGGFQAFNLYSADPIGGTFQLGGAMRRNVVEKPCDGVDIGSWAALASGGTVTFTKGSATVTGSGTNFTTDLIAVGDPTTPGSTAPAIRPHSYLEAVVVQTVGSDTSLTLYNNYPGQTVGPCPFWAQPLSAATGDTATFTPGSATITGTFAAANYKADNNHFISPADGTTPPTVYRIIGVTGAGPYTALTLAAPYSGGSTWTGTPNRAYFNPQYPATTSPNGINTQGYCGNATFTAGSPTVTTAASVAGTNVTLPNLPAFFTKTVTAGWIIRPQVTASPYRVASIDSPTSLTLATPFAGYSQVAPADTATLYKGGNGQTQPLGQGLHLENQDGTGYANAQVLGLLLERNLFAYGPAYYPSQPRCLATRVTAALPPAETIERNNTGVGVGTFFQVQGALPSPTTGTRVARQHSIVATQSFTPPSNPYFPVVAPDALVTPTVPDYLWYASDGNDIPSSQAYLVGGTSYATLAAFKAASGSEPSSILTAPTWAGGGTPPTEDLGSYLATLGVTPATDANYAASARSRPFRTWGPLYDLPTAINYYATQYVPSNFSLFVSPAAPENYYGAAAYGTTALAAGPDPGTLADAAATTATIAAAASAGSFADAAAVATTGVALYFAMDDGTGKVIEFVAR